MHRLMLTSKTYQQSASFNEGGEVDPENRLLWRYPRQRLEGEAIRDSSCCRRTAEHEDGRPQRVSGATPTGWKHAAAGRCTTILRNAIGEASTSSCGATRGTR